VRIPIKATAREPIKQAGYISATSVTHAQLHCETQPVHTLGSKSGFRFAHIVFAGVRAEKS
jgi:hypothetical protein